MLIFANLFFLLHKILIFIIQNRYKQLLLKSKLKKTTVLIFFDIFL